MSKVSRIWNWMVWLLLISFLVLTWPETTNNVARIQLMPRQERIKYRSLLIDGSKVPINAICVFYTEYVYTQVWKLVLRTHLLKNVQIQNFYKYTYAFKMLHFLILRGCNNTYDNEGWNATWSPDLHWPGCPRNQSSSGNGFPHE